MATIAWPTSLVPRSLEVQLRPQVRMAESIYTGQVTTFETPFSSWWWTITLASRTQADGAALEALLHQIRGPANRVSMWHHMRPTPRGSLQANTTVSGAVSQGASSLILNATTGLTMSAGDMFSVALSAGGTALLQVTADATAASNLITLPFAPQIRGAVLNGATATIVRPTALFVLREAPVIGYVPGEATPITLQFSEVFA